MRPLRSAVALDLLKAQMRLCRCSPFSPSVSLMVIPLCWLFIHVARRAYCFAATVNGYHYLLLGKKYNFTSQSILIVDLSAILATLLGEPKRDAVLRATSQAALMSAASLPCEIGNAQSALVKRGRLTERDSQSALALYLKVPIRHVEVDLGKCLDIAIAAKMYAYDAYLIGAATQLSKPLLTLDAGLARIASSLPGDGTTKPYWIPCFQRIPKTLTKYLAQSLASRIP